MMQKYGVVLEIASIAFEGGLSTWPIKISSWTSRIFGAFTCTFKLHFKLHFREMQVKCTMITRLKPFSLNLNQMMMMSSTILSKDRAKVQNHLMLVFSRRKIACPFWLFLVIFVISLLGVSNFVSHDRDFFAPCRVAIVALPNATFDWLNLLSVIVASFYDWSDPMIFDPS